MSTTVDERVVEMRFDNRHFEKNVQTTMSTVDKLKHSLNLEGATKGLESIDTAAKKVNMTGLSSAVQTVQAKFSALEVMAVTALANITNSAINTGKRMISALTIDPIKTGLSEYETKMNSIKTILSNTSASGTTLDDVNKALADLNTYSDKTIYNFAQMTDMVGKFAATSGDLDSSVSIVKGLANLAAEAGVDNTRLQSALYQTSQAMSGTYFQAMDWNSLENAGLGTKSFKNDLFDMAVAMGTLTEAQRDAIETGKIRWNDSLSDLGWMTTDVFSAVTDMYALDEAMTAAAGEVTTFTKLFDVMKESVQSGWAISWEHIIGDKEQSTELLTSISTAFSEMIAPAAEARNAMLAFWNENGGRDALIEGLKNAFSGLNSVLVPIKTAFGEVFKAMDGPKLVSLTKSFQAFTERLTLSGENAENLKRTFKGVFSVVSIVQHVIVSIVGAIGELLGTSSSLCGGLLALTASWGDWLVYLDETIRTTNVVEKVLDSIVGVIKMVSEAMVNAYGATKEFIGGLIENFSFPGIELLHDFMARVHERMGQVGEAAGDMQSGFTTAVQIMSDALAGSNLMKFFEGLWSVIQSVGTVIGSVLSEFGSGLASAVGNADFNSVLDIFNGLIAGGVGVALASFLKSVTDTFNGVGGALENITGILDGVRGTFEAYQTQLKAGTLLKIASAIGILAAAILVISTIDSAKLTASLGAITVLFADLMASMAVMGKISGELTGVMKTTTLMLGIATSVLILASALKMVADLDREDLTTGLIGVVGLTATMVAATKVLGNGGSTIVKGASQMILFAVAVKILASSVNDLSSLSWDEMSSGLVGVGILLTQISLFLRTAKFDGKTITTATGIVILAGAIKILASATADFGSMDWNQIGKGLAAIGALLLEIALFTNLTGNAKHVISTGVSLVLIGGAMKIFASAVADMGAMQWDTIGRGLTVMAGALAAVTVAVNLMPKNMVTIGIGLIGVSAAMLLIAEALDNMGDMSWEEIAKGLVALGGSMAILAVGLKVMNGTLAGSAALLIASAALLVLVPTLSILGAMSWEGIAKGLVALAGAFAIIGVAGLVLTPLVPTILALGGAFALIGIGVLGIGAGLMAAGMGLSALAVGFTALVAAGTAGAAAIVASLTVIITGVAGLIPVVVAKIGEGVIAFCQVIADGAPALFESAVVLISSMLDAVVEVTPKIIETIFVLLDELLQTIASYVPNIVQAGFDILLGFLRGIRDNIGEVVTVVIEIITEFVGAIADNMGTVATSAVDLIVEFIDTLGETIRTETPRIVEAVVGLGGDIVAGLVDGLFAGVGSIGEAVGDIGQNIIDGFCDFFGIHSPSRLMHDGVGKHISQGLADGITDYQKVAVTASKNMGEGIITGVQDTLGINSPSRVMRDEVGRYVVQGIAEGITSDMSAEQAASQKAKNIVGAFQTELDKFDLDASTADLEYELWMKMGGKAATPAEQAAAEMGLLANKYQIQAEKVALAQSEYQTTVDNLGLTAEETQQAYNKLLQAQIDLSDLASELGTAQAKESERNKESMRNYYDLLAENQEMLLGYGFTQDEVESWARSESGYDPNAMTNNMAVDVQGAVTSAMGTVQTAYANTAEGTLGTLVSNFSGFGATYATAMGQGIQNGAPQVVSTTKTMAEQCANSLKEQHPSWVAAGSHLVDGFIQGIQANVQRAAQEAAAMAMAAYSAAMSALQIASPSKKFAELGRYVDLGFAKGIHDYASTASDASEDMANGSLNSLSRVVSKMADHLSGDFNMNPVIRPVLDLSSVQQGAGHIGAMFSRTQALSIGGSMDEQQHGSASRDGAISFVQNNYSPKALSRLDIYRQTKNQFSALKGAVTG